MAAKALPWLEETDVPTRDALLTWLARHPAHPHRLAAASALASTGDPEALGIVAQALDAAAFTDRATAADAVARLGAAGLRHLAGLVRLLRDLDAESRRRDWWPAGIDYTVRARKAIQAVGRHDLDAMFGLLDHEVGDVVTAADDTLRAAKAAGIETVRRRWEGATLAQRALAFQILTDKRLETPADVAIYADALASLSGSLRIKAARALLIHARDVDARKHAASRLAAFLTEPAAYHAYQVADALKVAARNHRKQIVLDALRAHEDHAEREIRLVVRATIDDIRDE